MISGNKKSENGSMSTPRKSNSSSKKGKWQPKAGAEARKLANKESDWNLAVLEEDLPRTRGRKPKSVLANVAPMDIDGSPSLEVAEQSDDLSSLTEDTFSVKAGEKPPNARVLLEAKAVAEMPESHLKCPKCGQQLVVSFPTTTIASSCKLSCRNEVDCDYVALLKPAGARVALADDAGSAQLVWSTDYALNVTHVISFMASGDGGTEAERVLGLNGLPNGTSIQSHFSRIERGISAGIQECTDATVLANLRDEVRLWCGDQVDGDTGNKLHDLWLENKL